MTMENDLILKNFDEGSDGMLPTTSCSLPSSSGISSLPPVLDACCGSRMFWFDKQDPRALFVDIRRETWITDTRPGRGATVVNPDVLADFSNLPFPDNSFPLVIFDPPHLVRNGKESRTSRKYGDLKGDWRNMISDGFAECFRVLKPEGTLVFKWNELDIPVSEVLKLTNEKPLVGNRSPVVSKTHWLVFLKPTVRARTILADRCKHDAGHELNGVGMWICLGCRADISPAKTEDALASESHCVAAGTADEKPDGQAENASAMASADEKTSPKETTL